MSMCSIDQEGKCSINEQVVSGGRVVNGQWSVDSWSVGAALAPTLISVAIDGVLITEVANYEQLPRLIASGPTQYCNITDQMFAWINLMKRVIGNLECWLSLGLICQNYQRFEVFHQQLWPVYSQILCCTWFIFLRVNPYAGGGYFCQYEMMGKKLKNDWNPGTWVLICRESSVRAIKWHILHYLIIN